MSDDTYNSQNPEPPPKLVTKKTHNKIQCGSESSQATVQATQNAKPWMLSKHSGFDAKAHEHADNYCQSSNRNKNEAKNHSSLTSRAQAQPPEGRASNGMMMFKFHVAVKTEGAVAVACSELLDHSVWPNPTKNEMARNE
jgi:hypothetical protein